MQHEMNNGTLTRASRASPAAIRDFVEGQTTTPVADLWKVSKKRASITLLFGVSWAH